MQLLLSALLSLLAIGPAVCMPMDDYVDRDMNFYPATEQTQRAGQRSNKETSYLDQTYLNMQENNLQSNDDFQEEDIPLPKDAVDELEKQMNDAKENPDREVELQSRSNGRALGQGCTVALQFLSNELWLGCAGHSCLGAACPQRIFQGNDWTRCWGEVFQIFRAAGPGHICVGDFVGLYYPRDRLWFSMYQNYGRKLSCPGTPNHKIGFHLESSWKCCGAEIFQIYAEGKGNGATITDQDTLIFFFPAGNTYLSFRRGKVVPDNCPGRMSGHQRPPTTNAFDLCGSETVEITIRD